MLDTCGCNYCYYFADDYYGNKTMAKIKTRKHVYIRQLPHLWCWLIIATNLVSFCNATHTIWPIPAQTVHHHHQEQQHGTKPPTSEFTAEANNNILLAIATIAKRAAGSASASTGNKAVVDEGTKDHIGIGGGDDVHNGIKAVGSNETKNNNNTRLPEQMITEKVSLKSANTTVTTNVLGQQPVSATTMEMVTYKDKGYVMAISTIATSTSSSTALARDFNQTDLLYATTFHEECLGNRNSLAHVFTVALYSVVCVVGLFGNTLVIWVVFRFSKMQTVTNIYILNLAIADECFLIGIPFLLYTMRICSWKFGEYVCKAYMVSTSITQFTSSIFLLIMAADRYIAVCHPIESPRYRTIRIAKLVSMIAWITSAILMMPVILFATTVRQEDGINFSCNIDWPEVYKKHSGTTFILYTFLLGFAVPLCFISVFYYLVIRKLHTVQQKHKSKEKKRSHRKVTRLVLTVITVYVLCWLPHWISQVSLINSFVGQRELTRVEILLFLLFGCLAYSNSAMNPILYAFLSDNFRKSFSKAFSCMTGRDGEAQLLNEHSVFTHKRTGSGTNKRKGSRRLSAPRGGPGFQNNSFLAPTTVHNSAGGSSSGTSASTATTATDKSSNSNNKSKKEINGVICATTKDGEKITLVVNHEPPPPNEKQQQGTEKPQNQTEL